MRKYKGYDRLDFNDRKILFTIIDELSFKEKLALLRMDGEWIEFMSDPCKEFQIEAVSDLYYQGRTVFLIDEPCSEAIALSIEIDAYNVSGFVLSSEEHQLLAINSWGRSIKYIKNPTEKSQLLAIEINPMYIEYIKKPTKKVIDKYNYMTHQHQEAV